MLRFVEEGETHCDNSAKDNICSWPSTVERMTKEYNQLLTAKASAASTADEQTSQHNNDKARADGPQSESLLEYRARAS